MFNKPKKNIPMGFTLIETLVVLSVFSILAILVTSIIIYSLRGSKKSENTYLVRDKLSYAVEIIDRQMRNAKAIIPPGDSLELRCSTLDADSSVVLKGEKRIDYRDQNGTATYFDCSSSIASGSAELIDPTKISSTCSFDYRIPCSIGIPPTVTFKISGNTIGSSAESGQVTLENTTQLRTY